VRRDMLLWLAGDDVAIEIGDQEWRDSPRLSDGCARSRSARSFRFAGYGCFSVAMYGAGVPGSGATVERTSSAR
jgi:hypothetical protein